MIKEKRYLSLKREFCNSYDIFDDIDRSFIDEDFLEEDSVLRNSSEMEVLHRHLQDSNTAEDFLSDEHCDYELEDIKKAIKKLDDAVAVYEDIREFFEEDNSDDNPTNYPYDQL